jgi:hypothetical protein
MTPNIRQLMAKLGLAASLASMVSPSSAEISQLSELDRQNVVWTSPSQDHNGTMPIGNGDLAANVWVEPNGDLLFYLSKSDSWSPNQELLKLGRVRVRLQEPLVRHGGEFKQTLDLKTGTILIESSNHSQKTSVRFWIDAHQPVVNVEIDASNRLSAEVVLEPWRVTGATIHGGAAPDTILPAEQNTIRWYQRNATSMFDDTLKNQNLGHMVGKLADPLKDLTYGGLISASGLVSKDATTLVTKEPLSSLQLRIHALTAKSPTAEEWLQQLQTQRSTLEAVAIGNARKKHETYWANFWNKSWIYVTPQSGSSGAPEKSLIPANAHSIWPGSDTNGSSLFAGSIGRMTLLKRALSGDEIKQLASSGPDATAPKDGILYTGIPTAGTPFPESATWTQSAMFSVETWIKPSADNRGTRILDQSSPGKDDGFLFDTHPGNSLRLIVGGGSYSVPNCLKADEWNHVAVVLDQRTNRMEIYLNGERVEGRAAVQKPEDEFAVTRAYVLQRWIQACAGRGGSPIKFNGSLFTVDYEHKTHDGSIQKLGPDARQWGGCYWFQNTREPYWAMLYSGDYDQMEPLWKMYRDAMPLLKERTKSYFNHEGAFCSETMHLWGLNAQNDFGYGNKGPYPSNPYIRYYWDSGLELSMMMLDYQHHTQDLAFVSNTLIPVADEVVLFYDQHYKRDAKGKVFISPAMSLETWHTAENPISVVVGLREVLTRLQQYPPALVGKERHERWKRFLSELPETPIGEEGGKKWIKPADVYSDRRNSENPELYPVFPYRAYTVGKPDLEVALETWQRREVKRTGGWSQDAIQAAMLGLTQEARDYVVTNATDRSPIGRPVVEPRFPAFWGPNFDWTPDQCHGSVTLIALQRMLMLCDGNDIQLLPAWPQEWDVTFKLHAPQQTTIECVYRNGKIEKLNVSPASRRKDVILPKTAE